jgi:hypothetical protein
MNRLLSMSVLVFFVLQIDAQIVYYSAADYPMLGKISTETETLYERLPQYLKDKTRPPAGVESGEKYGRNGNQISF